MADYIQRRETMSDGEKLKQAIRARGYTIADFAKVAQVNPQTLRDWVNGRRATQIRVEFKVRWTLRQLPVIFGEIDADPYLDQAIPLPPSARGVLGTGAPRAPQESGMGHFIVPRPPRVAALMTSARPLSAFQRALQAVPPLEAWNTYGYRLVASPRAGAAFIAALADSRPWDAFPELGDRNFWLTFHAAVAIIAPPLWP